MYNKAHLKPSDYDNEGNVLPMGYKRLNDGTIIDTEEKGDLISRSEMFKSLGIEYTGPDVLLDKKELEIALVNKEWDRRTEILWEIRNNNGVDNGTQH